MKIEGVPDGWEPYAIGHVNNGETYMSHYSLAVLTWKGIESDQMYLKVRRIEPHCTWQHGMFHDGWLSEDAHGCISWFEIQPCVNGKQWATSGDFILWLNRMRNPPIFRSSLPWNERIQQVGPAFEATLRGET